MTRPTDLPDYEVPPIAEVSIGVAYTELEMFKAPHYGLLWTELGEAFSTIQHAPPIGKLISDSAGFPFPRVLFVHKDDNKLVQLQPDRFILNWRRTPLKPAYPRYEEIRDEFLSHLHKWLTLVRAHGIGEVKYTGLELAYVNVIPKGTVWESRKDLAKIVPAAAFPTESKLKTVLQDTAINWIFSLPFGSGELSVAAKFGKITLTDEEVVQLELRARTNVKSVLEGEHHAWFDNARRSIVEAFADLTSAGIQQDVWKRIR